MKRDPYANGSYMSGAMRELMSSNVYAFKTWKPEDTREDVIQEFFDFLASDVIADDEKEEKKIKSALKVIKEALPLFLNMDMNKVKQGEQELLAKWIKSVKGE